MSIYIEFGIINTQHKTQYVFWIPTEALVAWRVPKSVARIIRLPQQSLHQPGPDRVQCQRMPDQELQAAS